jgi:flagellin
MATGIVANTNISSISASRILAGNRADLERAMERLASGKRINSAADDATGLAVAAKMRGDIRSLDQAVRNTNDAISLVNTYDGASAEIEQILVRMRELATQASNGTYENTDLAYAHAEFVELRSEIQRIADNTKFNQLTLSNASFTMQIGPTTNDTLVVTPNGLTIGANTMNLAGNSVTSLGSASQAIASLDAALDYLAAARAESGATLNRLGHTVSNLMNVSQRLKEAISGIEDADYAGESAALARGMVLAQAGTAMLAQANQSPQYILSLLRG